MGNQIQMSLISVCIWFPIFNLKYKNVDIDRLVPGNSQRLSDKNSERLNISSQLGKTIC